MSYFDRPRLRRLFLGLFLSATLGGIASPGFCAMESTDDVDPPVLIRTEAYVSGLGFGGGEFGVGKVTFRTGQSGKLVQLTGGLRLTEAENRIFYPSFSGGLVAKLTGKPMAVGGLQTVWFLFRGNDPLQLTLHLEDATEFVVDINNRRRLVARRVFKRWWQQYLLQAKAYTASGDYPSLVQAYLTTMLDRRLDLSTPVIDRLAEQVRSQYGDNQLQKTFQLIFDTESIRADMIRELMSQPGGAATPDLPLPAPNDWRPAMLAAAAQPAPMETIASYVPEECFYLRFGNWDNQLWLKRLMEEYGGDLGSMIQMRGYSTADATKMLDQLVIESGKMDEWFGGNLIEDVAVIGTDLYVNDGASNGVLLLAKQSKSLGSNISSRRKRFAKSHTADGVTLESLEIDGHSVSLLSSPDNAILSYYVVADNCHLTTTSRVMVERFLQSAKGNRSLASNAEFQRVREVMPLERHDTVFIYLSRPFFQNLLSPEYQVELARRNRSLANIQLFQLAQMAAAHEGYASDSIDEMVQFGFLPPNFNQMPDGSRIEYRDGNWRDSMRGRRGYYRPIADVEVTAITPMEADWLRQRREFFAEKVKQVDPIVIGLRRFELTEQVERVVLDARIAPFGEDSFGWLGRILGPPMLNEVVADEPSLISFQASLAGQGLLTSVGPHQLFAAVHGDLPPKTNLKTANFFELLNVFKNTPSYVGAWPKPGYLDLLPALGQEPDAAGYTYSRLLGIWRLQQDDFALASFDRDLLEQMRHELRLVPAEHPAQLRLRVGDLASSNLSGWANALVYQNSWDRSIANVRLLNAMIQQFSIQDETALDRAEELLGATLVCSLKGQYEMRQTDQGRRVWQSTAWPSFDEPMIPGDYRAPPMTWFKGMSLDVHQLQTQFVAHGTLDIQRKPAASGGFPNLPSFNLFEGFTQPEELPGVVPDVAPSRPPRSELPSPSKSPAKSER